MKIALVILHADASRGGAERYTIDLAAALARRGHEVSLLAAAFAGEVAGVRNVPLDAGGATRARRYARFLDALDAHLDRERYDVVHAMLPVRRCDVYHPHAGMAAEQMGKWNRFFNPRRGRMAAVERDLLLGPTPPVVISLSEYVKRSILKHYPLPDERLMTLFNAVDLGRFQPAPRAPRDTANGLFIGHDFERKGLVQAFQAARALREPRLSTITVIGNGPPLLPPENAPTQFKYVRAVNDPRAFYADADFFVLPTKHDPCSLVVLEALAMGLPVISTVYNGATEIMTDGVHGYVLTDPSDVDALAEAMRKLLDPERRGAMREACLALRPRLSYEHHLDELMRIYDRAIARAPR